MLAWYWVIGLCVFSFATGIITVVWFLDDEDPTNGIDPYERDYTPLE